MEHAFTENIRLILKEHFGKDALYVFEQSHLIQYINDKTRSANKGSKSRGSFASLYAIYVLVEDYISKDFHKKGDYSKYEGGMFKKLFNRQRELPFGGKLQNHALNNRVNSEFRTLYPTTDLIPIIRNFERYWINDHLLKVKVGKNKINLSKAIIQIIDAYIQTKQDSFQRFIKTCEQLQKIGKTTQKEAEKFITDLLAPNVDARLYEIISYAILKHYYHDRIMIWGFEMKNLNRENLKLYKTGRTNANDGGIDFVMKPLGRFFQVTETLDFKKYFLDIDKIQRYPITFVIKSEEAIDDLLAKIRENALKSYAIMAIVDKYMNCIEEIINIPVLSLRFTEAIKKGHMNGILKEIILQSKVEFNYVDTGAMDG